MRLIDADKLDMSVKVDGDRTLSPISQLIAQTIIENAQTIESDEDCISRDAVQNYVESHIQEINTGYGDLNNHTNRILRMIVDGIRNLPSIQPKQKTGHWIAIDEEPHEVWECDHCGFVIDGSGCIEPYEYRDTYKYCPNCGAKMVEPQESEDKG